MILTIPKV